MKASISTRAGALLAGTALAALAGASAHAQAPAQSEAAGEDVIVVKATRTNLSSFNYPGLTSVITLDDIQKTVRDSVYVSIGLGVIAFQKAQVRRQELRKQVETIKERERAYEFWMNPKRAMLGVVIGPGDDRGDRFVGTRILAVTPGSGAEKAGLKAGDLIVGVDGKRVEHLKSEPGSPEVALGKKMGVLEHEQKVALEYERDGKPGTVTVTAMRPEHFKDAGAYAMPKFFGPCDCADAPPPPLAPDAPRVFSMPGPDALRYSRDFRGLLGLELVSMNADLASYFKTREGLLVLHAPDDGTLGLRAGDVIRKIGGKAIDEPRDAMDRLSALDKGEEVAVEIVRKGQRMMLQGTLPKLGWHGKHESRDLRIVIDKKD